MGTGMNILIEVKNMFGESVVCSVTIMYLGYIILQFGRRSVQLDSCARI